MDVGLERAFGLYLFVEAEEPRPRVRNRRGATSDNVALRSAKVACGKTEYLSATQYCLRATIGTIV